MAREPMSAQAGIPADAELGAGAVIHPGTVIGSACSVGENAVVGRQPTLGPGSVASREEQPPAVLDDGVAVCAGAVVLAGATSARE